MPRHFSLQEAEHQLPEVERALRDALIHKAEYEKAHQELESHTRRIRMLGGARVNPGPLIAVRSRRDTSAAALKEALERIEEIGAVVKDLDIGLIDFPTRFRGREVYRCWKLGEEGIAWWHGTDEGFAGRKAIDEDFLKNHEGDRVF